ncbi:MAG: helix-turn-helix domain-containing protein [Clostridia bacterium]|nr:helix-turn-helix domain-containing protein [Clostridia bacterium]
MNNLGEKIYKLRKAKGLSQENLAGLIGVSRQTIYKWESDYIMPSKEKLDCICKIFNVDMVYFYDDLALTLCNKETENNNKIKSKFGLYLVLTIIMGVILLCSIAIAVVIGFTVFSKITGDLIEKPLNIDIYGYLILLLFILLTIAVFLIMLINTIKNRKVN